MYHKFKFKTKCVSSAQPWKLLPFFNQKWKKKKKKPNTFSSNGINLCWCPKNLSDGRSLHYFPEHAIHPHSTLINHFKYICYFPWSMFSVANMNIWSFKKCTTYLKALLQDSMYRTLADQVYLTFLLHPTPHLDLPCFTSWCSRISNS